LSTPLRLLLEDVERSSELAGVAAEKYLESLAERDDGLLPKNPGAGSARHLSSVLHALLGWSGLGNGTPLAKPHSNTTTWPSTSAS